MTHLKLLTVCYFWPFIDDAMLLREWGLTMVMGKRVLGCMRDRRDGRKTNNFVDLSPNFVDLFPVFIQMFPNFVELQVEKQ